MLKKKSMDSFLREATAMRSLNYIKANGNNQFFLNIKYRIPSNVDVSL